MCVSTKVFKRFVRCFSVKNDIPFFLDKNYSTPLKKTLKRTDRINEYNNEHVTNNNNNSLTILNNIYTVQNLDLFDKLIRVYVDVLCNYSKYPPHVQYLHIFCSNLLREKVKNVQRSEQHQRTLFNVRKSESINLNEYLVSLNETIFNSSLKKEALTLNIHQDAFDNLKRFYQCKNVIYAFFTMESSKILFHFTKDILINDIENCLINYTLNSTKEAYRFIKKNGKDNIYIYILEYTNNTQILKERYQRVKNMFFEQEEGATKNKIKN